jgi:hypothetical protein
MFIIGYYSYPIIVRNCVSIEKANKLNIKKFETNRWLFQDVINVCNEIYLEQSKVYITIDDVPSKIERKLKRKGVHYFEVKIENTNESINVTANFYTDKFWYNSVLNNVIIRYNSYRQFEKCYDNELKARMTTICLGGGWFFEIDTDWL